MSHNDKWLEFKALSDKLNIKCQALRYLADLTYLSGNFYNENGLFDSRIEPILKRYNFLVSDNEKLIKIILGVETNRFGLRFDPTGSDFDILGPINMSSEEAQALKIQGFGFIYIVIGVLLIAAGIKLLRQEQEQAEQLRNQFNTLLSDTDKTLCKDPLSNTCKDWQAKKKDAGYEQKKTLSEEIWQTAKDLGSSLGNLGKIALFAAIPIAFFYFSRGKK